MVGGNKNNIQIPISYRDLYPKAVKANGPASKRRQRSLWKFKRMMR